MTTNREEDEELQMALRMSLQSSPPEAKRSKPGDFAGSASVDDESAEARNRRIQRELMAAAAEKRMRAMGKAKVGEEVERSRKGDEATKKEGGGERKAPFELGEELSLSVVEELFGIIFGEEVTKDVLAQWCNQGIRFSSYPETSMGLVQHEGGPCGVLATLQAFVLKYLLFFRDHLGNPEIKVPLFSLGMSQLSRGSDEFASISDESKARALVHAMVEILFRCGTEKQAVVVSLGGFAQDLTEGSAAEQKEKISKVLDGNLIMSASDFHKVLRVKTFTSKRVAFEHLTAIIPLFESRLGALLFLVSALLSRGLDLIQADRDDPSQPLVTAPFGHASQEIVNLLLCGEAVPNVFDGKMDLGGGMSLKGISTNVEVGFLSLLESLNLCKVGQNLKCPKWPIWVVGSESHYTVLFASDPSVQEENELEHRETQIRRAFEAQDQSGGGGFISVEGFQQVLREANVRFSDEQVENLSGTGIIVWSEFWQALLELDKNLGGMKDPTGLMGKKLFDIYHFNGIAKSVANGSEAVGPPVQRPRLCKLSVVVPPRWTPEDYLAETASCRNKDDVVIALNNLPQANQHAPLVDCIRTRWARAACNWVGDAPSIV
ncbi:protein FAM188A-like protein [Carex littledalei]|uniref:ubiquitinyl hydrolase 1 n=1 Tax=Carex littledalei TaxID=544730 RepID=A0A833REE1_9POAL|nr:protein FAM188A-like protein [Carex littledalei]